MPTRAVQTAYGARMDDEDARAFARARDAAALERLVSKRLGDQSPKTRDAEQALLALERERARALGEEYADELDFPVAWDIGAPLPHLLVNDYRAFLIFLVRRVDPKWDGTYATVKDPSSHQAESLALVELKRCIAAKLGAPNDEVFHGHPLAGRGQTPYAAQLVRNSRWLAELERINSVHACYRPQAWRDYKHYVFWFHDSTVECIAESFAIELHQCSFLELLVEASRRLVQ